MNTLSPALVWVIILVVLVIAELVSLGLTTIWFAIGSLFAVIVALLGGPIWLQVTVFLIVSIVLLYYTRPIAMKCFNKNREKTNVESMVDREGIVTQDIDNVKGLGAVKVSGLEWTARSANNVQIVAGAVVVVRAISGVKLIVEEVKEDK